MAEYIDRTALREALYREDAITFAGLKILNQFPAVDVIERKRAEWHWRGFNIVCTNCGHEPWFESAEEKPNFCPNCGADMRGE
jgi:membrane protease subunit (stomatin/prohibitin family)